MRVGCVLSEIVGTGGKLKLDVKQCEVIAGKCMKKKSKTNGPIMYYVANLHRHGKQMAETHSTSKSSSPTSSSTSRCLLVRNHQNRRQRYSAHCQIAGDDFGHHLRAITNSDVNQHLRRRWQPPRLLLPSSAWSFPFFLSNVQRVIPFT